VLQVEINSSSKQNISLVNSDGKILWTKEFSPGFHAVGLNNLSEGVYFLKGGSRTEKLIVQ
jgi:hypothetical protein